ncbi:glycerophosphoryl diester phosphodiesterase [Halomonas denitrificans]|uniref:glycerophosphodiester phosphodiesterase family protein n=1 Tax=Halomonas denitrificans TaxID=370769 RepID=UPI001CD1A3FF|nr:glycerophosphodiester phosphodiesterase family protein [Halomonas denitrificans]MCA0973088.1 glycerophosphoryl diester phosphodiesterase [Halomonas denitrificans]
MTHRSLPPLALPRQMAHRGLSAHAPENTLSAVQLAWEAGITWVELDVQLLGDGTPVIWHDPGMRRCSNGRGKLAKLRLEQAQEYDVGAWYAERFRGERMATLDDMLNLLDRRDMAVNLELKITRGRDPEALAESVIPRLMEALPYDRRLVSSFSPAALDHARSIASAEHLALGVLTDKVGKGWRQDVEAITAYSLHCDWKKLKEPRAREVVESGTALLCYTANDPLAFQRYWDWGVTSVISDDPGRFLNPPVAT